MDTIANNETMNVKKSSTNNADTRKVGAAAAGAGAVVGGVAGAAITGLNANAATTEEEAQDTTQEQTQSQAAQHHTPSHPTTPETPVTPTPETPATTTPETPATTEGPEVQVQEQPATEVVQNPETPQDATPEMPEEVNPDDIAQAIIAGEEIDPNDINAADVLDIAEVGTVYGADGEEYNSAYATDINGNDIVMVDVDGDSEYDVVTDVEGNLLACGDTGVNTSDAELNLNIDAHYMAADMNGDMVAPESMMDDIITT